jgi:hypothetical protein
MSCNCSDSNNSYVGACRQDIPYPQVSHESVPSLIDNLVTALYGGFYNPQTQLGYITKSVVNGRIVWNIPCDPNNTATIAWLPRNEGEGLLCYTIRAFNAVFPLTTAEYAVSTQTFSAAPSSPAIGQLYYDTTANHFYGWNGTTWKQLDN